MLIKIWIQTWLWLQMLFKDLRTKRNVARFVLIKWIENRGRFFFFPCCKFDFSQQVATDNKFLFCFFPFAGDFLCVCLCVCLVVCLPKLPRKFSGRRFFFLVGITLHSAHLQGDVQLWGQVCVENNKWLHCLNYCSKQDLQTCIYIYKCVYKHNDFMCICTISHEYISNQSGGFLSRICTL